jgi:hypothetical protein
MKSWRACFPNSRRIVFDDAGHQLRLQHPEQGREDVEQFFAQQRSPAP